MKILCFGSLNLDYVYNVERTAAPGETIACEELNVYCGGKGLNQCLAIARAGGAVTLLGKTGKDGIRLISLLEENGVDVSRVSASGSSSGHAIIQREASGQNCIVVYGGANKEFSQFDVTRFCNVGEKGDIALFQNETNMTELFVRESHKNDMLTALNPSPVTKKLAQEFPFELVDLLFINQREGEVLTGKRECDDILEALSEKYPAMKIILTLGEKGSIYLCKQTGEKIHCDAYDVNAVDTTGAGDAYTGYFLTMLTQGKSYEEAMKYASAAAAVAVTRKGAAPSIPLMCEVERFMNENGSEI